MNDLTQQKLQAAFQEVARLSAQNVELLAEATFWKNLALEQQELLNKEGQDASTKNGN